MAPALLEVAMGDKRLKYRCAHKWKTTNADKNQWFPDSWCRKCGTLKLYAGNGEWNYFRPTLLVNMRKVDQYDKVVITK
jgi:hypothetical protein